MTRALVTGGAGFIGSHLAERLLTEGHEVVVLDDLSMGRRENVPAGAELIVGSVLDEGALRASLAGVEVVFHEAARVSIRDSVRHFHDDAMTNVVGTLNLLRALAGTPVRRLVFASSMGVYGRDGTGVRETDTTVAPLSPYGVGKLAGESYCLRLAPELGVGCVALRYCNTYGPRQTPTPYVGVTTIFVHKLLAGERPIVFGDGEQVRDYVHVEDVVEANVRAAASDATGEVFNVGTGRGVTVNRVLELVARALGVEPDAEHRPAERSELRAFTADVEKARAHLGFVARWRFEDKVGEVVDYWRRRRGA